MKRLIYIILIALCANCSPLLEQPKVEMPQSYLFGEEFSQDSCTVGLRWWELFGDTTLNNVIEYALLNNRNLASALANVETARNYIGVAKAEFLPSIYLNAEVEAYRINGVETKEYSATPTMEWEISLFGKLRNSRSSAIEEYLSSQWGYRAAVLSLSTEVATTLFTLNMYERSLDIARRSYTLRREATALIDSMHKYGMSDAIALEQARSLVYSAKSEMSKYQRAVEQTTIALNLLLGDATPSVSYTLRNATLPPDIPIGIPSQLIERRPDVWESYFQMLSAASKVGVARADRFPSISLTADGGFVTETLKDLSSAKPFGWSLLGELTQPIFNFGALKRKEKMAYQTYISAMFSYEESTLSALSDVERALSAITTYRDQLLESKSLVVANSKIGHSTSALYKSGLGDYLSVIDAERELYTSQIDFSQYLTQQYLNYVDLVKALGGGY
ncbi:MAG: efflux transporter outer membrane subunit [Rikenellaceae bacterium]